jgi:hypothetical protein
MGFKSKSAVAVGLTGAFAGAYFFGASGGETLDNKAAMIFNAEVLAEECDAAAIKSTLGESNAVNPSMTIEANETDMQQRVAESVANCLESQILDVIKGMVDAHDVPKVVFDGELRVANQ